MDFEVGRNGRHVRQEAERGGHGGDAVGDELAKALSGFVGRPVVDETGLQGEYDVNLTWTPDAGPRTGKQQVDLHEAVETRSIFSAVREELGLDLVLRKKPVEKQER